MKIQKSILIVTAVSLMAGGVSSLKAQGSPSRNIARLAQSVDSVAGQLSSEFRVNARYSPGFRGLQQETSLLSSRARMIQRLSGDPYRNLSQIERQIQDLENSSHRLNRLVASSPRQGMGGPRHNPHMQTQRLLSQLDRSVSALRSETSGLRRSFHGGGHRGPQPPGYGFGGRR